MLFVQVAAWSCIMIQLQEIIRSEGPRFAHSVCLRRWTEGRNRLNSLHLRTIDPILEPPRSIRFSCLLLVVSIMMTDPLMRAVGSAHCVFTMMRVAGKR